MRTLNLKLKKKWFDMILSGEKKEEYREITGYWAARLFEQDYPFEYPPNMLNFWESVSYDLLKHPLDVVMSGYWLKFRDFNSVKFDNGYRKGSPSFTIECKGIEIREGRPEWGSTPGEKYFVIKLGKIQ